MIEKIIRFFFRTRLPLIAVILVLTAISSIYFFKNFDQTDNSLPVWFGSHDKEFEEYANYLDNFGNDRFVILAIELPSVFSTDGLKFIQDMTTSLEQVDDVDQVISLTQIQYIVSEDNSILVRPFVENIPTDSVAINKIEKSAFQDPDFVDNLFSRDGKMAGFLARVGAKNGAKESKRLHEELLQAIERVNLQRYTYYLSGSPITDDVFNRLVLRDQQIFFPLIVSLIVFLLFIFFRNILLAIIPTAIQVIVLLGVLGLYFSFGLKMNIVGSMLAPILVAVCVADSVHLILDYYEGCHLGLGKREALISAVTHLWKPCLYTILTTVAGFLSFLPSTIPPIKYLGTYTSIGLLLTFFLSLFIMPLIIDWVHEPEEKSYKRLSAGRFTNYLEFLGGWSCRHRRMILAISTVLIVLAGVGVTRITTESNFVEYFFKKEKVRQDIEFFEKNFLGVSSFEVVLTPTTPGWEIAKDPLVLKKLDQFKNEILADPDIRRVSSHVDVLKKLNQVYHDDHLEFYRIPNTQEEVAQLFMLAESSGESEIAKYKTPDDTKIHLSLRSRWQNSESMGAYLNRVQSKLEVLFSSMGIQSTLTGYGPLWIHLDGEIIKSQLASIVSALIVVSIMMMFFLKSLKVGLISMIPNVVPVFVVIGLMGFFGFSLNVSTVMIAAVVLGIVVDDTIHYLTRFKIILKKMRNYEKAVAETHRTIGKAIIFTSIILAVGFSSLVFSSFIPTVTFGAMMALTLLVSILGEIFILPVLLLWFKPFKV